jgi:tight adherence protein C
VNHALQLSNYLTAFFAAALLCVGLMTRQTASARRVMGVARLLPSREPAPRLSRGFQDYVFRLIGLLRDRLGLTTNDKLRKRFQAAGLRNPNTANAYFAARLLGPLAALILWTFLPRIPFLYISMAMGAAYLAPDLWLSAIVKKRREQIRLGLPDALDLMVVCVDAGLGIDQALLRTGQELGTSHPVLAEELLQLNLEQRAGKPRINAWRDMADRTQLETVKGFANMLAQSDRFGTPVSKALSTFADSLRKQRSQLAEELAAKTTIKLMFPLVLFIFPSMFIVLLGPAALTISRNLGSLGGK